MTGRSTMLPIVLIIVIVFLGLIAISSGRSDAPNVAGNRDYPHHVCTFNDYCEGDECSRNPTSFVVYLEHEDGEPRLELPRTNPQVSMIQMPEGLVFETTGGEVRGALTLYSDRTLNWIATSGDPDAPVEHFGSGGCERLKTP